MLMENAFCASKLSLILTETRQTRSLCIRAILSFADFSALDLSNILSSKSFPLKHLGGQRLGKRKKRNGSSFFDLSWVSRVVSFLSRIKERERVFSCRRSCKKRPPFCHERSGWSCWTRCNAWPENSLVARGRPEACTHPTRRGSFTDRGTTDSKKMQVSKLH